MRIAARQVVRRRQRGAGQAVEDGEVFGPGEDLPVAGVVGRRDLNAVGRHDQRAVVLRRVANHGAAAIDRAVGRLARDFGAAVAVEVVDHELRVVRAGPDVPAEIDPPEPRAIDPVGVDELTARQSCAGVVTRIRWIPLHDDLVLAVAVEVADARVVGAVGEVARRRSGGNFDAAARRPIERDGQVLLDRRVRGKHERRAGGELGSLQYRSNSVAVRLAHVGRDVDQVGRCGQRSIVHLDRRAGAGRAIDIECDIRGIRAQQTPSDVDRRLARANGDDATAEIFRDVLRRQRGGVEQAGPCHHDRDAKVVRHVTSL